MTVEISADSLRVNKTMSLSSGHSARHLSSSANSLRHRSIRHKRHLRVALRSSSVRVSASSSSPLDWSSVKTEAQFKGVLRAAETKGFINEPLRVVWEDFYDNYKATVIGSQVEGHDEDFVVSVQTSIAERVFHQFTDPYIFPSHHQRILKPFNYYDFGQRYVGSLVNFKRSFIGHLDTWQQIDDQLRRGENVVLLANHQTEADPGVFAHMIKTSFPKMAEDVIYVAGDRVITDPLCKPFSMGRNLFCVYSKRHIDDVPEEKPAKLAMNRKTVMAMGRKLNEGGLLLWIAPSGGRDRPREDGIWAPNTFDYSSVGLMQRLLEKARPDGHLYAMAMVSSKMMPPPVNIEETIGERRETNFVGVGISVTPEIHVEDILKDLSDDASTDAKNTVLANHARDICEEEFLKLLAVIDHPELQSEYSQYQQPWLKTPVASAR